MRWEAVAILIAVPLLFKVLEFYVDALRLVGRFAVRLLGGLAAPSRGGRHDAPPGGGNWPPFQP